MPLGRLGIDPAVFHAISPDESSFAVGGGHGTAVSLRALKRLSVDVTGVVSVADDGGSTGRLRAMLNVRRWGTCAKCLVGVGDPENPLTAVVRASLQRR